MAFFSSFPSGEEFKEIGIDINSKCIFLLELAAVCLAFKTWGEALRGMRVVCYCDNEGAKSCLMTGASSNKIANDLLRIQAANELKTGIVPWIARVPSKSNIADDPSRECMEVLQGFPEAKKTTVSVGSLTEGEKALRFQ